MVSTRKKRQSNKRLLSQLDDFDRDMIIGDAVSEGLENAVVNEGTDDQDFTVGTSNNDSVVNGSAMIVKTLERCVNERIDREMSNIVDTVEDRIQNAILTAIENIVAPKIELAVRSINASSGRDATSVSVNSKRRERVGVNASLENASINNGTLDVSNVNDETRHNNPDEVSELSVPETHIDRQALTHHRKGSLRKFSVLWNKTFSTENCDTLPPSLPPCLLSLTFFDTRNFLKHRRVPLRNVSILWDKNFSTENLIHPPPLMHKLFRYRKLSETAQKGCSMKCFGNVRQKNFNGESRYYLNPSCYQLKKNLIPKTFWNTERFPYEVLRYFETANFRPKIVKRPAHLILKFFDPRNFLKHLRVSLRNVSVLWDKKISDRKSWYPPFMHKNFPYLKFSEAQKGSPKNFVGTVRQKFVDRKSCYPPPPSLSLLSIKIFNTGNFLKHRRVLLWNVSILWDQESSTENRDTPPPSYA